jgi:hypothetical protein
MKVASPDECQAMHAAASGVSSPLTMRSILQLSSWRRRRSTSGTGIDVEVARQIGELQEEAFHHLSLVTERHSKSSNQYEA